MADVYDELFEEIKQMIEEDVTFDFQGNPLGHEVVASALAFRINDLLQQVGKLEEELRQAQVTMDSYADENQRFFDEIEQLKSRAAEPRGILHLVDNAHLEEPEPKCDICGRIIFCGVDELCKADPCGLKGK